MCILLFCLTYEKNLLRPLFKHRSVQAVVLPDSCNHTNVPYSFFSRRTDNGHIRHGSSTWSVQPSTITKNTVIIADLTTLLSGPPVTEPAITYHYFAPMGQGRLWVKTSSLERFHILHSGGLLWTNDQPVAETSHWQHTPLTRVRYPCKLAGFDPSKWAAADPRLKADLHIACRAHAVPLPCHTA